jgi:Na+/proline symporter
VAACGLFALVLALHRTSVYDLMVDSWSVLLATLFVPLTAGIWWRRTNGPGALASIVTGFVSWLMLLRLTPTLPADLLAVPFALTALVVISLATGRTTPPKPLIDTSGQPLAP